MKYLGIARKEKGKVIMPDSFKEVEEGKLYEVIEIENEILLLPSPLDKKRLELIKKLADESINEHRETLEELAK